MLRMRSASLKMNVPKAFLCILKTDIAWGLQKFSVMSENKVPRFKLSKIINLTLQIIS